MRLIYQLFFLVLVSFNCLAFETSADDIEFDTQNGICILSGNAVLKNNDNIFKADKITIYKKDSDKLPTKIIAFGNVSYSDGRNSVTSQKCIGNVDSIVFSQNVIVEGVDFGKIEADKAIYSIKAKKIDLTSKKKVKLTLDKFIEEKLKKSK